MREIKFRYYWKHDRTEEVKFYEYTLYEIKSGLVCAPDFTIRWDLIAEAQYTGLKDKNGKEIYEGDIITCQTSNKFKYPHKGEIIYLTHIAGFGITTDPIVNEVGDEIDAFTYFNYNEKYEVIGNIYEHPHLLKIESL